MIFKIRNKDGNFSSGGNYPDWSTVGKIWKNVGPLKSHLTMMGSEGIRDHYEKCEIIVYSLKEVNQIPIGDFSHPLRKAIFDANLKGVK